MIARRVSSDSWIGIRLNDEQMETELDSDPQFQQL